MFTSNYVLLLLFCVPLHEIQAVQSFIPGDFTVIINKTIIPAVL